MVGKATPDQGGSRKPPIEWALGIQLNNRRTRKTQRDGHNSLVKIWSLCSVSSTLSHATAEQPFRTLAIKWEVNMFVKKSSCVFLHECVIMRRLLLHLYSCVCLWYCVVVMLNDDVDDYITSIPDTLSGRVVLSLCRYATGIFCSPSQMGVMCVCICVFVYTKWLVKYEITTSLCSRIGCFFFCKSKKFRFFYECFKTHPIG